MAAPQRRSLTLQFLDGEYAICRVAADAPVSWADGELVSIVQARPDAMLTTVICRAAAVPPHVDHDPGWRLLRLVGPFGFGETGVLASVLAVLADAGVPVLTVCTFETDYVLFKSPRPDRVRRALEEAGHAFVA